MAANEVHVNMIFLIKVRVSDENGIKDISTYTTKTLYLTKPDASVLSKTMTFSTDGTNGYVQYTTVAGDLDQAGLYRVQVYLSKAGTTLYSDIGSFRVLENLV